MPDKAGQKTALCHTASPMVLVPSKEMKLLLVLAVVVCLPSPESGLYRR